MSNFAYVAIPKGEMCCFMEEMGFEEVKLSDTDEIVYGKVIKKDICLRVYTSIPKYGSKARAKGRDAIRCLVVKRLSSKNEVEVPSIQPIMKKAKRVYRVEGWKVNLKVRIDELTEQFGR